MSTAFGALRRISLSLRASRLTILLSSSIPTRQEDQQANAFPSDEHDATCRASVRTSQNFPSTHSDEYGSPEKVQKPHVVSTGLRFIFLALFTTALSAGVALLISHPCTNIT
jgi:hypothetical protein